MLWVLLLVVWTALFDPGQFSPSWWQVVLLAFALTQITVFATTAYLHRALAHKSLHVHPVASVGFRAILWLTTGQDQQQWVAVHRKHHTFTDKEGDPHSPKLLGVWRVQIWNAYYYMREARNPQTVKTFAPDLTPDRLDRMIFLHGKVGVGIGIGLAAVLFGGRGLAIALLHTVLYVFVLAPLINAVGHWRGGRNYDNTAYNSRVLAWFTGGESLHNNHHASPRAPKFSVKEGEFDPSWPFIRILAAVRLLRITGEPVMMHEKQVLQ